MEITETTEVKIKQDLYQILLLTDSVLYTVEEAKFKTNSQSLIFLSPFQKFAFNSRLKQPLYQISFHGDYYCIELHKHEVACNGLLFNAVYQLPHVEVSAEVFEELKLICRKMQEYIRKNSRFSDSIVKSYLQLMLSITSDVKQHYIDENSFYTLLKNEEGIIFQELVEKNYKTEKSVQFYAGKMNMSPTHFSRKIKTLFNKTPSLIIQERTTLEAKKLLHLTYKSVKEIAAELCFADEHYFSRYFKKQVGVSPAAFRKQVGISPAANLSRE